ncbi:MAG: hypothetical protein M3512_10945 [Bacteroidota bacterium]|jgi:hypothetical protein|nr:hypothetical protein [Bacteroidota bacterium]
MIKEPITEILKEITSKVIGCSYYIECAYSDGKGNTFLVITFYHQVRSSIIGKITYCQETGKVCQYFYKKKRFAYTNDIFNLLLDIYNEELEKSKYLYN